MNESACGSSGGSFGLRCMAVCLFLSSWGVASAETVLIGAGLRNGNFNEDASTTDSRNFDSTPAWFNIGVGSDQTVEATRTNFPSADGTRHAVLASGGGGNRLHAQNTLYDMEAGDYFRVSYEWRDAGGWDPADRIEVKLFITDTDGIGGVQTDLFTLTSAASAVTTNYQQESFITTPVPPAAEGKRLFVSFAIMDGNADANDFAQLDNFELVLNPEPVSGMLIGPGLRNGDFNQDVSAIGPRSFEVTPVWWNLAGAQTVEATRTNFPTDGTRHALLSSAGNRVHAQNTAHVLQPGDVFRVRYEWRDGFQWDDAQDRVEVRLFVTDTDLIGGSQTVVASMLSLLSSNNDAYQAESGVSLPADPALSGKPLFAGIYVVDGNGDGNDFAQLDNFVLEVNPVDSILVGPGVLNGDFEADTSEDISRSYGQTPNWWNLGTGDQTVEATRTNSPYAGNRRGVLSSNPNSVMSINPIYTIGTGDVFRVSYFWSAGNNWVNGDNEVEVRLFVTDTDRIGGVQTEVARFLSGSSTVPDTYEEVAVDSVPITDPALLGKRIFMSLDVTGWTGSPPAAFALIDNVTLTANPSEPLPEADPDPVDIVSISISAGQLTLNATGEETGPGVEYTADLTADPPVWIPITLDSSTFDNGTNIFLFVLPEIDLAIMRIVNGE